MKVQSALFLLAGASIASPLDGDRRIERRRVEHKVNHERAEAVKEAFRFAWDGYYKYAFPNDELHPVTNGYSNSRNGWGASAVDALSTAIVMELSDVVNTIVDHIPTINFKVTSSEVSVFETTIRYLGGILAGYDLLGGPFENLGVNSSRLDAILNQAKVLATQLAPAFKTPTGIPDNTIKNITTGLLEGSGMTGLAVAGTLVMEWTRLSDITGDPIYASLAQKGEEYLLRPKYDVGLSEPWPGLEGQNINYTSGLFADAAGGWVGGSDSFYEYLIKMWAYDADKYGEYKQRWIAAADSSIKHLDSHPTSKPDLTFMAGYVGQSLVYASEHLACFDGGNFLLGGLVLGEQKYIDFGLALTAGCHATYKYDSTGIGPEVFGWVPTTCTLSNATGSGTTKSTLGKRHSAPLPKHEKSKREEGSGIDHEIHSTLTRAHWVESTPQAANQIAGTGYAQPDTPSSPSPSPSSCVLPAQYTDQTAFYQTSGFFVENDSYDLRPEVMESYYYAYRITGDAKYQEWAWDAFLAINRTARVGSGFSAFYGVNSQNVTYTDFQESFFFAELMKYAFLIHAKDGPWQVNSGDTEAFVYNTEAHPFKVRNAPSKRLK